MIPKKMEEALNGQLNAAGVGGSARNFGFGSKYCLSWEAGTGQTR